MNRFREALGSRCSTEVIPCAVKVRVADMVFEGMVDKEVVVDEGIL